MPGLTVEGIENAVQPPLQRGVCKSGFVELPLRICIIQLMLLAFQVSDPLLDLILVLLRRTISVIWICHLSTNLVTALVMFPQAVLNCCPFLTFTSMSVFMPPAHEKE